MIYVPNTAEDLDRIQSDAALDNSPLFFGGESGNLSSHGHLAEAFVRICVEWGLPTQFQATDDFLVKWADAQKFSYSKDAGWIVSSCSSSLDGH